MTDATTSPFDLAFAFTAREEGGYANDKNDHGGPTAGGVTQATYNAFRVARGLELRAVKAIAPDETRAIYVDYWQSAMCDRIAAAGFARLSVCVMDFAFNAGDGTARKLLQEVLGVAQDKVIGPKTLAAISAATDPADRARDEDAAIARYLDRRALYCHRVIAHDATQARFHDNWMARVRALARFARIPIGATYEKGHAPCVV
jgi:lysozyme family protein